MKSSSAVSLTELLNQGYRYALALTHNPTHAEDVLQDAWLAVLKAKGPHQRAYLFRAIRSRFINQHRRDQMVAIDSITEEAGLVDPQSSGIDALLSLNEAEQALGELRPIEREALFLFAAEGFTVEEIAEHTQHAKGTVLSLIHRARKKLQHWRATQDEAEHVQP